MSDHLPTYSNGDVRYELTSYFINDDKPSRAHPGSTNPKKIFADLFMNWILANDPEYPLNGFKDPPMGLMVDGKNYSKIYDYLQNDFMPKHLP